jgi:uncharacterized glyoxalase superfamily protein PhnB
VRVAIEFLTNAFGFRERTWVRHTAPDGVIGRTQMAVMDSVITLGLPSVHGESPRHGVSAMLYVYVDDVDEHFRQATQGGARVVLELADRPWGDRTYQVIDPEGHQWTFAQHLRDVALEDDHLHASAHASPRSSSVAVEDQQREEERSVSTRESLPRDANASQRRRPTRTRSSAMFLGFCHDQSAAAYGCRATCHSAAPTVRCRRGFVSARRRAKAWELLWQAVAVSLGGRG